jgi:ribosomal protein L7/L12
MRRFWAVLALMLGLMTIPVSAGEKAAEVDTDTELSKEELAIIKLMETLQLMDLVESKEVIDDMDILLKENGNEQQN